MVNAWDEFDQLAIDTAIGQWRARLEACVEANGGALRTNIVVQ